MELAQLRRDLTNNFGRAEKERRTLVSTLKELDMKVENTIERQQKILVQCENTQTTLRQDIVPEVSQSRTHLQLVKTRVEDLKQDVNKNEQVIRKEIQEVREEVVDSPRDSVPEGRSRGRRQERRYTEENIRGKLQLIKRRLREMQSAADAAALSTPDSEDSAASVTVRNEQ